MSEFKPFRTARLKVDRADQHINELDARLRAFLATDFHRISVKVDPQTGENLVQHELLKPVPDDIGLVVGDAIHNLRAALDLAAAQMVTERGGVVGVNTFFPISKSPEALIEACKSRDIKMAGANVIALIVDQIRPYKGGNDALFALHELDIFDKHRLLIPHVTVARLQGVDVQGENGVAFRNMTFVVDSVGRVVNEIAAGMKLEIKNHGKPTFAVLFDKGLPLEGQPVVPSLVEFSKNVRGTIDALEAI